MSKGSDVLTFAFVKRILLVLVPRAKNDLSSTTTGDRHAKFARNLSELIARLRHQPIETKRGKSFATAPFFICRAPWCARASKGAARP